MHSLNEALKKAALDNINLSYKVNGDERSVTIVRDQKFAVSTLSFGIGREVVFTKLKDDVDNITELIEGDEDVEASFISMFNK